MEKIMNALADTKRINIMDLLREGPLTVGEIAEKLEMRQPQVSKHLRILYEAGLVKMYPQANKRIYDLDAQGLEELDEWMSSFRSLWEERFDRLEDYLEQTGKEGNGSRKQNNP